ncbi:DUF6968 family protein [Roseomonas sp. CCTCC AB2023176]|uniref:DUF6968 family protein n=1 Tax=Roseomonas sp. CCTCC AB2023176 TaxID=3342640 RepID=UPI0035D5CE21
MNGTEHRTIARRELGSVLGPVIVELDGPRADGADAACNYRIAGPRIGAAGQVRGVDGFQALHLAMERIGAALRASEEFAAGPLRWLDMDEPGFPLPPRLAGLTWRAAGTPPDTARL